MIKTSTEKDPETGGQEHREESIFRTAPEFRRSLEAATKKNITGCITMATNSTKAANNANEGPSTEGRSIAQPRPAPRLNC
jgi:hypothetical protein